MQLRWTQEAAHDLEHIADYLFEHAPANAEDMVREIYQAPAALLQFPHRGRPGRKQGTREMVLSVRPYIVIYRLSGEVVQVVRILHAAQKWP